MGTRVASQLKLRKKLFNVSVWKINLDMATDHQRYHYHSKFHRNTLARRVSYN